MSYPPAAPVQDSPFVHEQRLGLRQWGTVLAIVTVVLFATPRIWEKAERFETGPDYRIPYSLSNNYWLFERRLKQVTVEHPAVVLGDSVIWGEYVLPDGTWSHFLNAEAAANDRFINAGVNGLFPLALEGLIRHHGNPLRGRKVLLHCNLLWMSSPKADLQSEDEGSFNHPHLVPQFRPRIPSYQADATERLGAVLERNLGFLQWVSHVQATYFGQKDIPSWTLEAEGGPPPRRPNAYKNPFNQITLEIPAEPKPDSKRGPASKRHRPWSESGTGLTRFEWVPLPHSLQWSAFQRVVHLLRERGNDVLVVVGPFNEHLLAEENRAAYRGLRDAAAAWLKQERIPHALPSLLPSALYADASHPLTDGYRELAREVRQNPAFSAWLDRQEKPRQKPDPPGGQGSVQASCR